MVGPNEPLDCGRPRTPGERRTGRNFGLSLLAGGAAWRVAYATRRPKAFVVTLIVLLVGKVGVAISAARTGRYPGFAWGLFVALGVALLVAGGCASTRSNTSDETKRCPTVPTCSTS